MALESGSRLGPYEVEGLLGSGGMGDVYRARDPRLDREVAIKVLPGEIARDPRRLRRFEQEARAAGALNHPNILDVHDIGIHEDAPYVVSELLEGQTLRIRLEGGALPMRKALDYALQIARGLAAVHDRGIVHQDLKPEKIFITEDGRVKILDFGLAKLTRPGLLGQGGERRDAETTELGMVMGTAGYMSPEQVRGEEADHRSDVFSFGAVLYEMLSGQRAFRRDTAAETMNAILKEDPLTLPETGRGIPQGLAHIVERCLEKRAGERFDTAHDLGLALEVVWSEASGRARPAAVRRRRLFGVGALVVLAGLAGVGRLGLNRSREPEVPPSPVRIRTITSGPGPELTPALSSEGDLLAYVWARERREDLYVKLIDGGEPLLVSEGEEDGSTAATLGANGFAPAWSPDGRWVVYVVDKLESDIVLVEGFR